MGIQPHTRRTLAAIALAVTGVVLTWRALDRSDPKSEPHPPAPEHVLRSLDENTDGLVTPTEENIPGLLDQLTGDLSARLLDPANDAIVGARAPDLVDAYRARLMGLLAYNPRASYSDMVDRGWPEMKPEQVAHYEEGWERLRARRSSIKIDPGSVEPRSLDERLLDHPTIDSLDGLSQNCSYAVPLGANGQPRRELARADEGLIEIRVRAVLPNADDEPTHVLLGYLFTWDTQMKKWRWVRTCIYRKPGDGSFAALRPI